MIHRIRLWLWERKRRELLEDAEVWRKAMREADAKYLDAPALMAPLASMLHGSVCLELGRAEGALEAHEARRPRP